MGCFFFGSLSGRAIWLDESDAVDRYVIDSCTSCSPRLWYAPIEDEL